jgi:hypothetical protein
MEKKIDLGSFVMVLMTVIKDRAADCSQADDGYKLAALWEIVSHKATPRKTRVGVAALATLRAWELGSQARKSGLHKDPVGSRIQWWAKKQRDLIPLAKLEEPETEIEIEIETEISVNPSDGLTEMDEETLKRAAFSESRSHKMAQPNELDNELNWYDDEGNQHRRSGVSMADSIGPWAYALTDSEGEEIISEETGKPVILGYESSGEFEIPDRWEQESEAHVLDMHCQEGLIKGDLSDEKAERGNRFSEEFMLASETPEQDLTAAYKAAWVRYRSAQLGLSRALKSAPLDHGLWSRVYLTKDQWGILEAVYASRTGLNKKYVLESQYGKMERAEIARQRPNDQQCKDPRWIARAKEVGI